MTQRLNPGGKGRRLTNVVSLVVSTVCVITIAANIWDAVHEVNASVEAAVTNAVGKQRLLITTLEMVAGSLGNQVDAVRAGSGYIPPNGKIAPVDCDTVEIVAGVEISTFTAGLFRDAGVSSGERACLYYMTKLAFEAHDPRIVRNASIFMRDGQVSFPLRADEARISGAFAGIRRLTNEGGRPAAGGDRTTFYIKPDDPLLSEGGSIGVAILVSRGRYWEALTVVTGTPVAWQQALYWPDSLPGSLAILKTNGEVFYRPGVENAEVDDGKLSRTVLAPAQLSWFEGFFALAQPVNSDLFTIWSASTVDFVEAVRRQLNMGTPLLLVLLISVAFFRRWTLREVIQPSAAALAALERTTSDLILTINTMPDAMCIVTRDGTITTMNAEMARLLDLDAPVADIPLTQVPALLEIVHHTDHTPDDGWIGPELDIALPNGKWVEVRLRRSEERHLTSLILVDITSRKQSEIQQREARLVVQRAEENLQHATERLVSAEKMRALSVLVAGFSHEVKTPLGTALTASTTHERSLDEMTAAVLANALTEEQFHRFLNDGRRLTRIVSESVNRAVKLVQNFKGVSVEHSIEEERTFDLGSWFNDVSASLAIEALGKDCRLEVNVQAGLTIRANPMHLWQVVENLVQNALFHAYPEGAGGIITITGRLIGDQVKLSIRDDGTGIQPEIIRHIFEPFFTTKRGSGGTGLGLAIVHNLVIEALRGDIQAVSETDGPNRGAEFVVSIPWSNGQPHGNATVHSMQVRQ